MKKKAVVLCSCLIGSLMLGACSFQDVASKFTGNDTGEAVSGSAVSGQALSMEYNAADYVTVGEYKGIEVDCTVGDDEVKAEIDSLIAQNKKTKKKKGKCKKGETVNINFEGKIDGKNFEGGTAKGQEITLGSSGYIDGFDDGVIGMKTGQKKDLKLKFPKDYHSKEVAGKPVVFTVKLNHIVEEIEPKFDDKFVKDKTDYKTVSEYKEKTKEKLVNDKKEKAGETAYQTIEKDAQVKGAPENLKKAVTEQLDAYYKNMAKGYGFEKFEDFLKQMGMDEEGYKKQLESSSDANIKTQLISSYIADKEGITITDDEVKKEIEKNLNSAKQSDETMTEEKFRESFKEYYGTSMSIEDYFKIVLRSNKVIEFLKENAKIKE